MEPTTLIIIGLLVFGGAEHLSKEKAQEEVTSLEAQLQEAKQSIQTAVEVNESNASTITDLKNSVNECGERYVAAINKVNQFKEVESIQAAAIQRLQTDLSNTDFAQCRVPDWVSLEGITAAED